MTSRNGALRIFLYNWPIYVGTWVVALAAFLLASTDPRLALFGSVLGVVALAWSLASLAVSSYIYDRSVLSTGSWVPPLLGARADTWATIHAGLDAEVDLSVMPGRCLARLDVFDPTTMTSPSIERARGRTPPTSPAVSCTPTALALEDATCDVVVVAFTAHEIRGEGTRERFFGELRRVLRPGGRVLLVEHLRDFMNFLAFGPGFLHFVARREWLRLAAHAGLSVASETRITPWVMALTLQRAS